MSAGLNITMMAAVAGGGACGAMTRYAVSHFLGVSGFGAGIFGVSGPLATVLVNVTGSALMGILAGMLASGLVLPEAWRLFIAVGFLGALTTFSSFAFDAATLIDKQGLWMSILYIGVSVCLSLAAFAAAHYSAGSLLARLST